MVFSIALEDGTESSETSAYNNTLTPGTYPKEKRLQSKHGESLKSRIPLCYFSHYYHMYHQLINRPTKSTRRATLSPQYTVLTTPAFWDDTLRSSKMSANTNTAVFASNLAIHKLPSRDESYSTGQAFSCLHETFRHRVE